MEKVTVKTCSEYQNILNLASQRFNENKVYFKKLKKVKSGPVDSLLRELHEEVFTRIDCLKCSNCCRGTGPLLRERDISRLSHALKMKPGSFNERYLIMDEDGDFIFKELPCPFIQENNFCMVYSQRPGACRDYPHIESISFKKYSSQTLENTKICPGLYLVFEEMKKRLPL